MLVGYPDAGYMTGPKRSVESSSLIESRGWPPHPCLSALNGLFKNFLYIPGDFLSPKDTSKAFHESTRYYVSISRELGFLAGCSMAGSTVLCKFKCEYNIINRFYISISVLAF